MVDSALCTLLDWNYKDMDMLEGGKTILHCDLAN